MPATAEVILESNSIYTKNLKGIGIGNGWVNPYVQYGAYAKVSGWERQKEKERERESFSFNLLSLQYAYMKKLINESIASL